MRQVDDAHQSVDEREPARQQEQECPERQPVEDLEGEELGGHEDSCSRGGPWAPAV